MNKQKLNDLYFTTSIHTLCIKTLEELKVKQGMIDDGIVRDQKKEKCGSYSYVLNLNKIDGDIFDIDTFIERFQGLLKELGIDSVIITRIDLRLDSYDKDFYERFEKLMRFVCCCLTTEYKVKNNGETIGLLNRKTKSLGLKNKYFQVEYYDKYEESNGKDEAFARFELRELSLKLNANNISKDVITYNLYSKGIKRLEKALLNKDNINRVYDKLNTYIINDALVQSKYISNRKQFLASHKNIIMSTEQLKLLLDRLDEKNISHVFSCKNTDEYAKTFKRIIRPEYFSKRDLKDFIGIVKSSISEFLKE